MIQGLKTTILIQQNYPIPPLVGESFYRQKTNYKVNQPSYTNNGDGTITDNVTGLCGNKV
ncbi:hypothetical protein BWZ22_14165 [Seonamhaeicola sp. S2-3]|nr:hypothetical protein BWZ22_14165 [Seonamhaeicola sp. S2-3]